MRAPRAFLFLVFSLAFLMSQGAFCSEEMILIPGGSYIVGEEGREVYLPAFYIDRYEVTNSEFARFLNEVYTDVGDEWLLWVNSEDELNFKIMKEDDAFVVVDGYEDYPVVTVSWHGAMKYAEWAGKSLPTGVQWEVAARGGSPGRFPWGDDITHDDANYYYCDAKGEEPQVIPVGSFPPNSFGISDVIGNVWEWTTDNYETDYLSFVPSLGISPAAGDRLKVLTGGSFLSMEEELGLTKTFPTSPVSRMGNVGFRCVMGSE